MFKKLIVYVILVVAFVLTFSTTVHIAYGYFDLLETSETVSVVIGDWNEESPEWNASLSYSKGDKVTYKGVEYIAIKSVPVGKYPIGYGYSKNFWKAN